MRTKATLFLLVLVAALGAVAYYFNQEWDAQRRFAAGRTNVLGPDAVDLDHLEISFQDTATTIQLEKHAAGWELVSPVRWPANFFAVNRLLSQLQNLERETSFPAGGETGAQPLSDYGLDPPAGRLIYGRRGERSALLIGKATDVGNRLYVLPERGERVYVVGKALLDSLRLPIEEFRSSSVFTLPLFEVRSSNVQLAEVGNLRIWLSRDGDKWKMETPVQARADRAAVETLLTNILGVQVARFETGQTDLNVLRLATPDFIVTFEGSGRRESLLIGAAAPGAGDLKLHYGKLENNPTIFTFEAGFLDELRNAQIGLRDRHVLEFERENLQSLTILPFRGDSITLQQLENGEWQVVARPSERGPINLPGDKERIEALIDELAELRAVMPDGFVTDAPSANDLANTYALASPRWQVVVTRRSEQNEMRRQTLLLGSPDTPGGSRMFAQVADERAIKASVYLVDRGIADDLSAEPRHFRNRQLQQLPQGARITSLTLRRLSDGEPVFSFTLESLERSWSEALAGEPEVFRVTLVDLIGQLRNLRAREIVATEFSATVPNEPTEKPWTWLLEAVINLEGGAGQQNSTFRLYLDDYAGGSDLLASTPDLNLAFSANQALIDAFGPIVYRRADPGPPPPGADRPPGAAASETPGSRPTAQPDFETEPPPPSASETPGN